MALNRLHAAAKTNMVEDLSGCKLPHGTIEIPEQGSPKALNEGGHILSIAGQKLHPCPWEKAGRKPKSMAEYVEKVRNEKAGDLAYSSLNGGTLIAMSGKIRALGEHFLYELSGKDHVRPAMIFGKEEKDSSGNGIPGAIEYVDVGSCFILKTVDGKAALIRVLAKQDRSALIQWVYQPNGSAQFDIPKGPILPLVGGAVAAKELPKVAGTMVGHWKNPAVGDFDGQPLLKAVTTHLANRESIIKSLLELLAQKSSTVQQKAVAIRALGRMRTSEAAPTLAAMIGFFDSSAPSLSLTIDDCFLCVPALAAIGKPGSAACLEALVDGVPESERYLMVEVMMRVEGADVSDLLLKKRLEKAKNDKERKNIEKARECIHQARK